MRQCLANVKAFDIKRRCVDNRPAATRIRARCLVLNVLSISTQINSARVDRSNVTISDSECPLCGMMKGRAAYRTKYNRTCKASALSSPLASNDENSKPFGSPCGLAFGHGNARPCVGILRDELACGGLRLFTALSVLGHTLWHIRRYCVDLYVVVTCYICPSQKMAKGTLCSCLSCVSRALSTDCCMGRQDFKRNTFCAEEERIS